jgi:L-ascorbate metabolism protein UlaG (beta-lactamase superfamily)
MQIKWLGHSSFLFISRNNIKIITDPYTSGGPLMYSPIDESADIVTISHNHSDHNNPSIIKGNPIILKEAGAKMIKDIKIKAIPVFHDESSGSKRGNNLIFCFQIDNMNLCHLGDLGHSLNSLQLSAIGAVDILFIPVGGYYTFSPVEASLISSSLNPKLIFPMHYKTSKTSYPISGVEEFIRNKPDVRKLNFSQIDIYDDKIPSKPEIIILKSAY